MYYCTKTKTILEIFLKSFLETNLVTKSMRNKHTTLYKRIEVILSDIYIGTLGNHFFYKQIIYATYSPQLATPLNYTLAIINSLPSTHFVILYTFLYIYCNIYLLISRSLATQVWYPNSITHV